ncbi:MAG: hypothetical protein AAGF67_02470, partial [Verrucomicrobiota bacterium]
MKEEQFEEQAQRWLNGQLDESGFAELQDSLRESSENRELFHRLANLDSGLRDQALLESSPPVVADFSAPKTSRAGWMALAAAVAVLGVATWMTFSGGQNAPEEGTGPATLGIAVITAEAG